MARAKRHPAAEWPTIGLAVVIHGAWLAITFFWQSIPVPILALAGGWLVAWHGSLQHEVLHGHPTRSRRLNDLVGSVPLGLWLPYPIYRASHLRHHNDEALTDPIDDPESAYLTAEAWGRLGAVGRCLADFNNTLAGRLTLGPLVMISGFLWQEASRLLHGDTSHLRVWLLHLAAVGLLLSWVVIVCGMPASLYLVAFVYAGAAFTRLRSFAEHRSADERDERTAIVEQAGVFGLLFLNNNLHVLHHKRPRLPWYRLPATYREEREALIRTNGGLVYAGYGDVARRFLFRRHDTPLHPTQQALYPGRSAEAEPSVRLPDGISALCFVRARLA
ncbi:MAG: fatty acid desaturase [Rhizobiaceae bacterium]|nr:fatty acid desaturase [Rhizobiaceae bacterium]